MTIIEDILAEQHLDRLEYQYYEDNIDLFIQKCYDTNYKKWYNVEGVYYYDIDSETKIFIDFIKENKNIGYVIKNEVNPFTIYDDAKKKKVHHLLDLFTTHTHRMYYKDINDNFRNVIDKI